MFKEKFKKLSKKKEIQPIIQKEENNCKKEILPILMR